MRRLLLLIIPALILVALYALSRTIPSWRYPVITAPPGDILYAATFDGAPTDWYNVDWDQFGGRLSSQITDGVLQIRLDDYESGTYSVAAPYFADFDITVHAQATAGPEDNAFGIVFRLQDKDNDSPADDSYYLFLISSDGYYQVVRVVDGVDRELSTWINSDLVQTGLNAPNILRVRAAGDTFQFFINGEQVSLCIPNDPDGISTYFLDECIEGTMVESLTDPTITNGRLGVGARSFSSDPVGVIVNFDNITVISPTAADASAA